MILADIVTRRTRPDNPPTIMLRITLPLLAPRRRSRRRSGSGGGARPENALGVQGAGAPGCAGNPKYEIRNAKSDRRFILARLEKEGSSRPPRPIGSRSAAGSTSTSSACRRRRRRSMSSSRTRRRTPTRSWSRSCWRARTTASAGRGAGSTRPATPTATGTRRTSRGRCGRTATGSSTRSTRDMPYDRFVIEQIAGDLLPNATQDQIVATGLPPHVDAQRGGRASTPSSSAWTRCSTGWTRSARRSSG